MSGVSPLRLLQLKKLQCAVFQTAFNPKSIRTGAKYLRARLRGPSMLNYYPELITIPMVQKEFPSFNVKDLQEEQRLEDVEDRKSRGKGTPRKARNKDESRRTKRRR
ncbi:mitochondrial ribosomal subunit S27 [Phanerochaete sordida]|uniref:Small ribosomal subunit protein mS33 n=1 Tax=Phanerochaete sordida TaxID=48140 RepID=A0A9P3G2Z0_9APHY|nr:mitochondrial ribosomal subunit S27 [Phanerochaete sordida]